LSLCGYKPDYLKPFKALPKIDFNKLAKDYLAGKLDKEFKDEYEKLK